MRKNVNPKLMSESVTALTEAMKANNLWPSRAPSSYELASTIPFSVDRLDFNEWLAFIFCPKLKSLLAQGADIPMMSLSPALEVYLPDCPDEVKRAVKAIDVLFSE